MLRLKINEEFGLGIIFWLWDAPMGYNQLAVALASQEKLAFEGPDAIKWTYTIMPFGPTNGPATFINFIHDVDSQWKALAQQSGFIINDKIQIQKSLLMTFSAGPSHLKRHCWTWNVSFVYARPTDSH